jgi:hypothetical protein
MFRALTLKKLAKARKGCVTYFSKLPNPFEKHTQFSPFLAILFKNILNGGQCSDFVSAAGWAAARHLSIFRHKFCIFSSFFCCFCVEGKSGR